MAVTRNTPVLGMRGRWALRSPWSASNARLYSCTALRTFSEMITEGIDINAKYYAPKGLTEDQYNTDLAAGAVMCILYSDAGEVITVPDTYVETFPGIGMSNYGTIVVSASMGPVRLNLNLDFLKEQMANLLSDTIGVTPTVYVDLLESPTALTQEEADAIEAARISSIKNRTSTYAENIALRQTNASQAATIQALLAQLKK